MVSKIQNSQAINSIKANTEVFDKTKKENQNVMIKNVDSFEKENNSNSISTYSAPKKLTSEEITALNDARNEATSKFIAESIQQNISIQAGEATINHYGIQLSQTSANLLTEIFGSLENALPAPATTPEGALANISEGGSYSVESVSERIMLMATTLAAGDPSKLLEMEKAVKKGFEAAGFDPVTGGDMPQITMDTYNHVMNEFDKLKNPQE